MILCRGSWHRSTQPTDASHFWLSHSRLHCPEAWWVDSVLTGPSRSIQFPHPRDRPPPSRWPPIPPSPPLLSELFPSRHPQLFPFQTERCRSSSLRDSTSGQTDLT